EGYVFPFFVAFALLSNVVIFIIFIKPDYKGVIKGQTTRIYYLLIAISDFIEVVSYDLLAEYLQYGVWNITGNYLIEVYTSSNFSCKIIIYIWFVTEGISNYALLIFSIERCNIVYFPLKVRGSSKFKKVFYWLIALNIIFNLGINIYILVFN